MIESRSQLANKVPAKLFNMSVTKKVGFEGQMEKELYSGKGSFQTPSVSMGTTMAKEAKEEKEEKDDPTIRSR